MEIKFTIPVSPRTKKNSQRPVKVGKRIIILPSKEFETYQNAAGYYIRHKNERINCPCEVTALFYMPTRRLCDLTNLLEALDDVLVHYGVLEDDNSRIIVSHDGSRVLYDKENPRTEVKIKIMEEKKC